MGWERSLTNKHLRRYLAKLAIIILKSWTTLCFQICLSFLTCKLLITLFYFLFRPDSLPYCKRAANSIGLTVISPKLLQYNPQLQVLWVSMYIIVPRILTRSIYCLRALNGNELQEIPPALFVNKTNLQTLSAYPR